MEITIELDADTYEEVNKLREWMNAYATQRDMLRVETIEEAIQCLVMFEGPVWADEFQWGVIAPTGDHAEITDSLRPLDGLLDTRLAWRH